MDGADGLDRALPALRRGRLFLLRAFGEDCMIGPDEIAFSENPHWGPKALLVSLYALHAMPAPLVTEPFQAFKDLPGSMPYHSAFSANSERVLAPRVDEIERWRDDIVKAFGGKKDPPGASGDFSFLLYPMPKVGLCYIFYLADEEFPPSVTCLFTANALTFMPLDGLADVAEYTSREILHLLGGPKDV
ncbi:MAG: DUF3786 domain-containing protein [Deltaproteobacteria bacterium]|nr:DUF3786 domain-containing protein [Deltaproteobacteria bacterium]